MIQLLGLGIKYYTIIELYVKFGAFKSKMFFYFCLTQMEESDNVSSVWLWLSNGVNQSFYIFFVRIDIVIKFGLKLYLVTVF